MVQKYKVSEYTRQRVEVLDLNIESTFGEEKQEQLGLAGFHVTRPCRDMFSGSYFLVLFWLEFPHVSQRKNIRNLIAERSRTKKIPAKKFLAQKKVVN